MFALALILSITFAVGLTSDAEFIWLFVSAAAFAIVVLPMMTKTNGDFVSTWNFTALNVILGVCLRNIYIFLQIPDYETIDFLYLRGADASYFYYGSFVLLVGLVLIAFGYIAPSFGGVRKHQYIKRAQNARKLYFLVFVLFCLSLLSTVMYVRLSGGLSAGISGKRNLLVMEHISTHHTFATLRFLASVAFFAHLLVVADLIKTPRHLKAKKLLAFVLFLLACFLPFYSSTRTPVAMYFMLTISLVYFSTHNVPKLKFAMVGVVALTFLVVMSAIRTSNQAQGEKFSVFESIDISKTFVRDRNNLGLAKTSHIVESIPETLQYKYGGTMVVWLIAWVPREMWPSKPPIGGEAIEIGNKLYGTAISGVPPGLIGEFYWNFGIMGVLFGCLLMGVLLKYVHIKFRPKRGGDPFIAAIYCMGPLQLGFLALGHSVGYGIFNTVLNTIGIYVCVSLVSKRSKVG